MEGFSKRVFQAPLRSGKLVAHDVYERGAGSPVVIVQELPGIGQETLRLADKLIAAGHRVVLPHLFGPLGRVSMVGNMARVLCMRHEFTLLEKRQSSPVVDWLRALCRDVRERCQVKGVGVIGMCLTGNFALTLVGDDSVLAAVASQPSMPAFAHSELHMSAEELSASRAALDAKGAMLALRFERDPMCRGRKFAAIAAAFNDDRERVRLHTLPGRGHSVLTLDFVDQAGHPTQQALQAVLGYFSERLG